MEFRFRENLNPEHRIAIETEKNENVKDDGDDQCSGSLILGFHCWTNALIVTSSNCEKGFKSGFGGVERGSYLTANSVPFFFSFFFLLFSFFAFEINVGCRENQSETNAEDGGHISPSFRPK